MKNKYLLVILFVLACVPETHAQWDAQISQYWRTKTYFNPAFAGETSDLQAVVLHRQQWVGITRAPKTFIVSADMPIKFFDRVHGVGLVMMVESIGLFSNKSLGGQYVFKKSWKKNTLNLGIQGGFATIGFDASKIELVDGGLTTSTSSEDGKTFDANFGVSWVTPDYYVGLSITHLLKPTMDLTENSTIFLPRTYYFTGGYNIRFQNPLYELQPSFLVKADGVFVQYDVTARLEYNKLINGGVSWRKDDGFVFLLGLKYKGIDAGYSYDLSTSEISKASSGTHEFFVRFSMPIKLDKTEKNRQKSVRIL